MTEPTGPDQHYPHMPLFSFIGKAGAGKTTCVSLLAEHFGYARLSFAGLHPGGLRDVMVRIWGPDILKAPDFRDKAQALGAAVRQIDEDAWVNSALRHLHQQRELGNTQPVANDDLRYTNEAWALTGEGFVIVRVLAGRHRRIARLEATGKIGTGDWENHESETALDKWPELYTVYNEGNKKDLFNQLAGIIARERNAVEAK